MLKAPIQDYPRHTKKPFPDYHFIPGENPHPFENPLGHSYGQMAEDPSVLTPQNWQQNEIYLFGVDLFNYAFWWESHEAFESLWKKLPRQSPTRTYLQGLIKISAAFLKWHAKNQEGLDYLYTSGIEHLLKACSESTTYLGLDLMDHIAKLSDHFRVVVADENKWPDPLVNYPFIVLEKSLL